MKFLRLVLYQIVDLVADVIEATFPPDSSWLRSPERAREVLGARILLLVMFALSVVFAGFLVAGIEWLRS